MNSILDGDGSVQHSTERYELQDVEEHSGIAHLADGVLDFLLEVHWVDKWLFWLYFHVGSSASIIAKHAASSQRCQLSRRTILHVTST